MTLPDGWIAEAVEALAWVGGAVVGLGLATAVAVVVWAGRGQNHTDGSHCPFCGGTNAHETDGTTDAAENGPTTDHPAQQAAQPTGDAP